MNIKRNQDCKEENYSEQVSRHRTYLMGIAMLSVLIYHAFCWIYNPIGRFNLGYIGVDIFLFLSGFGLTYSYKNNTKWVFWKKRLNRIYPLYAIVVVLTFFLKDWSFIDLMYNLSTLGFYVNFGINRYDWYVESLFTLYLLFPLIYRLCKRYKLIVLITCLFIVSIILYFIDIKWWYDCFISRLPIFIYGILFKEVSNRTLRIYMLLGLILYIPTRILISPFLAGSLLSLFAMYVSVRFSERISMKVYQLFTFLGKYSLEFYLANVMIHNIFNLISLNALEKSALYIILQCVLTFLLISINKKIHKIRMYFI